MKRVIIFSLSICLVAGFGAFVYLWRPAASPVSASVLEPASSELEGQRAEPQVSSPEPAQPKATVPIRTVQAMTSATGDERPASTTRASALSQRLEILVSPQSSFQDKQAVWRQLQDAGEMNQAIADLKQRASDNPNDPQVATTLGEAELFKLRTVDDFTERGLLALQADQSFNSALKNEPANWEAQYYKASSMSYWPADLHKGDEVVQRLSSLIDQQEAMAPQPQFARTYVVLGQQYQRMGQLDYAQQTWRLGAAKFPNDPGLQQMLAGEGGR